MELDLLPLIAPPRWTLLPVLLLAACGGSAPDVAAPLPMASAAIPPPSPVPAGDEAPGPIEDPGKASSGNADSPTGAADAAAAPELASAPPPLPRGTRVLHIGDSMAGALGIELGRQLEAQGVKATLRAETASYTTTWAWGARLPDALTRYNPDLVVITLGTNELQIADPGRRARTIQHLVAQLGDRPCVWISPPPLASGTNDLVTVIRQNCPPCAFMNTEELYPDMPRLGDRVHPTLAARAEWARRVVDWLATHRDPNGSLPWSFRSDVIGARPPPLE